CSVWGWWDLRLCRVPPSGREAAGGCAPRARGRTKARKRYWFTRLMSLCSGRVAVHPYEPAFCQRPIRACALGPPPPLRGAPPASRLEGGILLRRDERCRRQDQLATVELDQVLDPF